MKPEESLSCSQCEILGEISFDTLQRDQLNTPATIFIKDLPLGITESGIKNLLLSVGQPIFIIYKPNKLNAIVQFKTRKEAELAIRDLHQTPPYNLHVTMKGPKVEKNPTLNHSNESLSEKENFKPIFIDDTVIEKSVEDMKEKNKDDTEILEKIKLLNYDPSVRLRQRKLDYETESRCVSLGRGYYYKKGSECPVGGLTSYSTLSENFTSSFEDSLCESCKFPTVKMCKFCSKSICSKECGALINHINTCQNNGLDELDGMKQKNRLFKSNDRNSSYNLLQEGDYELEAGCNVVVCSYSSLKRVYVRIIDEPWEELFCKLCNYVAFEGVTGKKFQVTPKNRNICAAKYYKDSTFYRGQIKNIFWKQMEVEIFFIDFGNRQVTKFEDLRSLPQFLMKFPGLAVEVTLKDVANTSTPEAVVYFNKLTAEEIPLVIKFDDLSKGVALIEKDTSQSVNRKVNDYCQPSWKIDDSVLSKLGKVYFMESLKLQTLEVGNKYSLTISHFDEKEFLESGVFWVVFTDSDYYYHAKTEMKQNITEYCEYLKNDSYLPRVNELCLAKEKGQWHRCLNLKTHKTSCFLFFVDDGHSSLIETQQIRKIIGDFIELPSQSICCMLSGDVDLKKEKKETGLKVAKFLKKSTGKVIKSILVKEYLGDAYRVVVPEIMELIKRQ